MYEISYAEGVADDLRLLPANRRAEILERIEVQLEDEPTKRSRNRKMLVGLVPPWDHAESGLGVAGWGVSRFL